MQSTFKSTKKQQRKKLVLTVFAVGAAGIFGYFGWQYYKKRKALKAGADPDAALKLATSSSTEIFPFDTTATTPGPKKATQTTKQSTFNNPDFPLVKGSKGDKVRQLQEALIAKYGKAILPKFGADGDFGSETISALKKIGFSTSISESTFNVLTGETSSNTASIGKNLLQAVASKDFTKVLAQLKAMRNTEDYATANETFKNARINGVRKTIVNGLLDAFPRKEQSEKIKYEFLRIGLQYDGNKWSLSGLDGLTIFTIFPTTVWVNANQGVKVPARMVLGNEVAKRLDYTLFANKGKYFLVPSNSIGYL